MTDSIKKEKNAQIKAFTQGFFKNKVIILIFYQYDEHFHTQEESSKGKNHQAK